MRIGIIGAGRIGRLHIENLVTHFPEVEIYSVSDIDLSLAKNVAKKFRIPHSTGDPHELCNDAAIQVLLICSSTDTHASLICAGAAKKKHIFCEKPIDLRLSKVATVLETVKQHGVKFQVGFNRRFDRNPRAIKSAMQAEKIGTPHLLKITSRDPSPPPFEYIKVSGGLFKDMMIHDFDMARFLLEREVKEVTANGAVRVSSAFSRAKDVDTAVVTLRFEDDTLAVIDNSRQAVYGYDQRIEVFGSKGVVSAANEYPNSVELSTVDGVCKNTPLHFFLERYHDSYIEELRAFFYAIEKDIEVPVTGFDGKQPLLMAEAALRSLHEKRTVALQEIVS